MLYSSTLLINFVCLIAAVWLGIYVISRNARSLVAWLTGLTLWSMAGLFLNTLLAMNPPPLPENIPNWVAIIFPFWMKDALEQGSAGWLQGWLVIPAIIFWHHVTVLIRPGKLNAWRRTRIILGYIIAGVAILLLERTDLLFTREPGDPLFLNTLNPGPLYPLFMGLLIFFTIFCLVNLVRSSRAAPTVMQRNQLNILILATLIAGLTGPVDLISEAFSIHIPRVSLSVLLGIAVILLGYGVAQYSALVEGRTIRRDFIYNAVAMAVISGMYVLVTWISAQIFAVPAATFIFLVLLAIITHSLFDIARQTLDYFFFNKERRAIRQNLHGLASSIGQQGLQESLRLTLDAMCVSVRASYGLIILFQEFSLNQITRYRWQKKSLSVSQGDLAADDVLHLEPGTFPAPLDDTVLLIPLYTNSNQFGAILFGTPVNGIRYSQADVDLLLYPSDQIADAIHNYQHEEAYIEHLSQLSEASQHNLSSSEDIISVKVVEQALRNLFDFAYLGDSPLVKLRIIRSRSATESSTYIDRGKVVNSTITEALEKLRPTEQEPKEPIPREWYPYMILHGAYLEDRLNRDIMSKLYISEGTFNRTRRSAIRSVTRVLEEMEAALHRS
jgi:GAF domain-containing protein